MMEEMMQNLVAKRKEKERGEWNNSREFRQRKSSFEETTQKNLINPTTSEF